MPSPFAGNIEFHKLLAGQTDVDLPQLMLEFATDAYPQLDGSVCLDELDRLGRLVAYELTRLPGSRSLEFRLAAVSRVLYETEGFRGNEEQYYDPRNSYLNEVLERRLGIPISLGVVYMAVAARVDLQVDGVCAPGHFVLTCSDDDERWFIDPFSAGEVLSLESCRRRVESRLGEDQVLSRGAFPAGIHVGSCGPRTAKPESGLRHGKPLDGIGAGPAAAGGALARFVGRTPRFGARLSTHRRRVASLGPAERTSQGLPARRGSDAGALHSFGPANDRRAKLNLRILPSALATDATCCSPGNA